MNPAKIIEGEIQAKHRVKVFPLFAKRIGQPRESADRCPHTEV